MEVPTLTQDARAINIRPTPLSKRLLDVTVALIQLVLTAPLWVLIPLAIKLDDGGPVFFSQPRVGKGGKIFRIWKFRSMTSGYESTPQKGHPAGEHITQVGKILRATALDELPQLWNIIIGDMSFVGPRPVPPEEKASEFGNKAVSICEFPGYEERHAILPGLTGFAQTRAPRDITYRDKFRYDLLYVRRRTFWLDIRLILLSVWISLRAGWPDVGRGED